MNRTIITTADGSHSISIPSLHITYHSTHGALQESMHVFINAALQFVNEQRAAIAPLAVFEMGFGTGLNALLTLIEAETNKQPVYYESIDLEPITVAEALLLNYCTALQRPDLQELFMQLHLADWGHTIAITPYFSFRKNRISLLEYQFQQRFNIIYFDAFAPDVQPALWTSLVFEQLVNGMEEEAVLTTYCSKSIVRKAMAAAGLQVTKIPGPPHKREMVRAIKKR
ncbi:MAG TPA: tRNA (5-methylaminomethyl-2-thiouridine)(34)-methyltransferase MnmD [Chitinophagaceae bacterium]|nr:tRNA (5-methylaminomethyl-2-thiouridine)(34)-methyltransferase MnmD [Chitinophagaceae bacterium]